MVDPKIAIRFHVVALLVWFFIGTPVTILWLSGSTPFIAWMSLYAIVVSHWSAFQGAHAEKRVKDDEENSSSD